MIFLDNVFFFTEVKQKKNQKLSLMSFAFLHKSSSSLLQLMYSFLPPVPQQAGSEEVRSGGSSLSNKLQLFFQQIRQGAP